MTKKRVHQVAKEFNVSSEALIEMLRAMGISAKSHMSTIEETAETSIRKRFEAEKATVREEYARKEIELAKRREQEKPRERPAEAKKRFMKKSMPRRGRPRDASAVQASVKKVMALMDGAGKSKKRRKKQKLGEESTSHIQAKPSMIRLTDDSITVSDLSKLMNKLPADVIRVCMDFGMMVTINQRLDMDTVEAVSDELGFTVEREMVTQEIEEIIEGTPESRSPVVTVMGHVDHGKTSLLDFIREANVVAGEAGGITQHMGAYEIISPEGKITFIDTPGHEAFTAMRTRGAQITDIVVLVVAADEGVKPQTVEAINHAKDAGVSLIVAINKIDLPDSNPDMVRQQLSSHGVMVEQWGGDVMDALVSARTGEGIDKLLELILLQAEMMELTAVRTGPASGVVLEARLDPGFGPVATVLVRSGTLHSGDAFVAGSYSGRARALMDESGRRIDQAPPSKAVQLAGISGVPRAGESFQVMSSERAVRDVAARRSELRRAKDLGTAPKATLEDLLKRIREGEAKELRLLLKGDVQGSVEALSDALDRLANKEVHVNIIHQGVGAVTESDVLLASASQAIIVSFHVRPSVRAQELAEREGIEIRHYQVIYECVEDMQKAMEGLLEPELREKTVGRVSVRQIYHHPKAGTVAGCFVLSGTVTRGARCRVLRDDVIITDSRIGSLKRFKEDVREVQSGYECGVVVDNYGDIHEGDVFEIYVEEEFARSLN